MVNFKTKIFLIQIWERIKILIGVLCLSFLAGFGFYYGYLLADAYSSQDKVHNVSANDYLLRHGAGNNFMMVWREDVR